MAEAKGLITVYAEQLFWHGAVPCSELNYCFEPKPEWSEAPFTGEEGKHICFNNEPSVRKTAYEILHYNLKDYFDDGPPALDQIVPACVMIEEAIKSRGKVFIYVPAGPMFAMHQRASALCTAAHAVLMRGTDPAEAGKPWEGTPVAFYIHSWAMKAKPAPERSLTMPDCLKALKVAKSNNWVDMGTFNAPEYLSLWRKYDLHWLLPGKVQVLGDPMSTIKDPDPTTVSLMEPEEGNTRESFINYFKQKEIKLVVRMNMRSEPGLKESYDPEVLRKNGIAFMDASYDDVRGGVPSEQLMGRIITECEKIGPGAIAFHCKAGFGRSVLCACVWMVYSLDMPGEVVLAWARLCRPGSITTVQQARYLLRLKGRKSVQDLVNPNSCCSLQ